MVLMVFNKNAYPLEQWEMFNFSVNIWFIFCSVAVITCVWTIPKLLEEFGSRRILASHPQNMLVQASCVCILFLSWIILHLSTQWPRKSVIIGYISIKKNCLRNMEKFTRIASMMAFDIANSNLWLNIYH